MITINIIDLHVHTVHSFDCDESTPDKICKTAIEKGISHIAFCDHADLDMIADGYNLYDDDAAFEDMLRAKEKYKDRLNVICGVELGAANQYPEMAEKLINKHKYDYVLGSLHSLSGVPDFAYFKFEIAERRLCERLFERYLDELNELLDLNLFDTLAHLTYPIRYFMRGDKFVDLNNYKSEIDNILKKIIKKGLTLELNTQGLRRDEKITSPTYDIVERYYSLGGRNVCCGSDAHFLSDIVSHVEECQTKLKEIGFEDITYYVNRKPQKSTL